MVNCANTPLRKKLRKYPGLNTPLGIPGVFPGIFSLLVYFWPFWGYFGTNYGWMPHNAIFGFLDLAPSILHSNWFWDYIS
jgi:hypothetical protein